MTLKELASNNKDINIELSNQSIKFLKKLNISFRGKLVNKIDYALNNKRSLIPLKGTPKRFKIRFNDIRVVLVLVKQPKGIKIMLIDYRGNVYQK